MKAKQEAVVMILLAVCKRLKKEAREKKSR
jgi:hypothetical protein